MREGGRRRKERKGQELHTRMGSEGGQSKHLCWESARGANGDLSTRCSTRLFTTVGTVTSQGNSISTVFGLCFSDKEAGPKLNNLLRVTEIKEEMGFTQVKE